MLIEAIALLYHPATELYSTITIRENHDRAEHIARRIIESKLATNQHPRQLLGLHDPCPQPTMEQNLNRYFSGDLEKAATAALKKHGRNSEAFMTCLQSIQEVEKHFELCSLHHKMQEHQRSRRNRNPAKEQSNPAPARRVNPMATPSPA